MLRTGLDIVSNFFKPNPIDKTTSTDAEVELYQLVEKKKALEDATLTKSELDKATMHSSDTETESIDKKKTENEKAIIETNDKISVLQREINENVVDAQTKNLLVTDEKQIEKIKTEEQTNLTSLINSIPQECESDIAAATALAINAKTCDTLSIALDGARYPDVVTLTVPDEIEERINELKKAAAKHFNDALNTEAEKIEQNDKIHKLQLECLPDVVFEYNDETKKRLKVLRENLVRQRTSVLAFQDTCVSQASEQLATVMRNYPCFAQGLGKARELMAKVTARRLTSSWTHYLNCPNDANDESVDATNQVFFNRVASGIEGLSACSIYSSREWLAYKKSQALIGAQVRLQAGAPPPPPPPPPLPEGSVLLFPPQGPVPPELYYDTVTIGPYRYVIGPIVDFQNIEGRIFIYVKCYDDDTYTTGTYFWVYRSQSEGLYRVFFKLIPNDSIEKGYDYTQASLVVFRLQVPFCNYYEKHSRRGKKNPIVLNTLGRLNYFMKNMSYLQRPNFLDIFPGATIRPSRYSIPGPTNPGWIQYPPAPHCANPAPLPTPDAECCYVCLTRTFIPPPHGLTQSPRMIGHYYTIDARYGPIIHKGFPMNLYAGMQEIRNDPEYDSEFQFFQTHDAANPNKFSRLGTSWDTTYPYIFCFTTCCMIQPCSSFDLFVNTDRYKKTFWCQGFDNFTSKMTPTPVAGAVAAVNPVLSPVLYVIIGAFLSDPDFALSAFRNDILNVLPLKSYNSSAPIIDEYRKSSKILMTLGTKERDTSIYQPAIDPYPRRSAIAAFKSLRDKINKVNTEYKRRILLSQTENVIKQRLLVKDNVKNKLDMLDVIAAAAYSSTRPGRQAQVIELLRVKADFDIGQVNAVDLAAKVQQLRAETLRLSVLLGTNVSEAARLAFINKIGTLSGIDATITAADKEIFLKAIAFIRASPTAAATAIFRFKSSQEIRGVDGVFVAKFEDDLTDYALLCLKQNWLRGMMDNAYGAGTTVFDPDNIKLHYLDQNGNFVYMGDGIRQYYNPSGDWPPPQPPPPPPGHEGHWNPLRPYLFKSSFDEMRSLDANDKTTPEVPVTVCTLSNMYQVDCYYDKPPTHTPYSMSTIFQVSSTIVYTREINPIIPYAIDMQKIPLSCIPDLPEVVERAPAAPAAGGGAPVAPTSQRAGRPQPKYILTTYEHEEREKREEREQVEADLRDKEIELPAQLRHDRARRALAENKETSLMALLAANPTLNKLYSMLKSPYTLCGTSRRVASYGALLAGKMMDYFFSNYKQLPLFFENFPQELQLCHQYCSTALIYDSDVPPYNLLQIPPNSSFLTPFVVHFQSIGVTFNHHGSPPTVTDQRTYIQHKLQETTRNIKALSDFLTKDFMIDAGRIDKYTVDNMSQPSESSTQSLSKASESTTNSQLSKSYCSFDEGSVRDGIDAFCYFFTDGTLEGSHCGNDPDYLDDGESDDGDSVGDAPDDVALDDVALDDVAPDDVAPGSKRVRGGGNKPRFIHVSTTKRNRKYKIKSSPKRKCKSKSKSKSKNRSHSRHRRISKITNKTFCRKRKSYLSRKPYAKQTLKKGVKH